MPDFLVPAVAGLCGVAVMTFFLRRARFLHLPETQMVRAIGSYVTKRADNALLPGSIAHAAAGIVFAYIYRYLLTTVPDYGESVATPIVVCSIMGLVHGLIVTLFLVIAVAQYHPVKQFQRLDPSDMAAHVIAHLTYGATVGVLLVLLSF